MTTSDTTSNSTAPYWDFGPMNRVPSTFWNSDNVFKQHDYIYLDLKQLDELFSMSSSLSSATVKKYMHYIAAIVKVAPPLHGNDPKSRPIRFLWYALTAPSGVLLYIIDRLYKKDGTEASMYMKRDAADAVSWILSPYLMTLVFAEFPEAHQGWQKLVHYRESRNAEIMAKSMKPKGVVLSIEAFKTRVRTTYERGSEPRAMMLLYAEVPARDDFQLHMCEIPAYPGKQTRATDIRELRCFYGEAKQNTLFYDLSRFVSYVCLGKTKTVGKHHAAQFHPLSEELTRELFFYHTKKPAADQVFLFSEKKNCQKIRRYMKQLKIPDGNINYIRRMHRMEALTSMDGETMVDTAARMGHSPATAFRYHAESRNEKEKDEESDEEEDEEDDDGDDPFSVMVALEETKKPNKICKRVHPTAVSDLVVPGDGEVAPAQKVDAVEGESPAVPEVGPDAVPADAGGV